MQLSGKGLPFAPQKSEQGGSQQQGGEAEQPRGHWQASGLEMPIVQQQSSSPGPHAAKVKGCRSCSWRCHCCRCRPPTWPLSMVVGPANGTALLQEMRVRAIFVGKVVVCSRADELMSVGSVTAPHAILLCTYSNQACPAVITSPPPAHIQQNPTCCCCTSPNQRIQRAERR